MSLIEEFLSVPAEDIEFDLRGIGSVPWSEFLLNPRRLRGSDFLMRWSQGVWSEQRLIQAVNKTKDFYAIPYGPSSVAPSDNVRAFELYFERLERAGLGKVKRPDLLVFPRSARTKVVRLVRAAGGVANLPFTEEGELTELLRLAIIAVECENSLWRAEKMPGYGLPLTPQRWLGGRAGVRRTAVLPTIILKEEDRPLLQKWQKQNRVRIHIWHAFYERAYGISFDVAQNLIENGLILPTRQVFQAPGGPTTTKVLYKIFYQHAYSLAVAVKEPSLDAKYIQDRNGHILPYVRFHGGRLKMTDEALQVLSTARSGHR